MVVKRAKSLAVHKRFTERYRAMRAVLIVLVRDS
jgi:hypothetical protein